MNIKLKTLMLCVASMLLLWSCADKHIIDEHQSAAGKGFTLTASLPGGEAPATRISLTDTPQEIQLRWEENDRLQLCYVQGATKVTKTVTVRDITADGKQATFDIEPPEGIDRNTPFDLCFLQEPHAGPFFL